MDIRNIRQLNATVAQRLDRAQYKNQIVLIYTAITLGLSALVTVITYWLNLEISKTGGLSNMGLRSILSTVEAVLPIVQNFALLCLEMGFLAAMLRISRGLYTSPQTLRAGMSRFWAVVRCTLLLSFRYLLTGMICFYLATAIFSLTPLSNKATEILMPIVQQMTSLDTEIILEDAVMMQLIEAMIPMFVIFAVLLLVMLIPMYYRYRMANYVLMDKPAYGAVRALNESKMLMRGNGFALFKVDLSLWWYYLLTILAAVICYGDSILALLGVALPWSNTVSYFLFFGLFLIAEFAIYYFFSCRVGVTYALAYEALKPKEEESGGVVLGNIFQM